MKRVIRGSVTSSNNNDLQSEYEYRRKVYLKRKHEFETLGEQDNNDVLSREEKMNIAKAEMDKVAPKSVKSAKDATFKTDKRLSPTSERYKGYLIVLDRGGDGYNVYDKHRELEDAGYPSRDAAKKFIDELVEADNDIRASSITASEDIDALWEVIDDEEFEFQGIQDVGYDNDGNIMVVFNHAISEYMIEPTAEELLMAFRQYGYPVHEWNTNGQNVFILSRGGILGSTDTDIEDEEDLPQAEQEYDSAKTSINSNKLPAIYNMITLPEGSVGIDYGGGKFDNAVEALAEQGVTLHVYDPYNRSQQHNRAAIKALRANGGADFAINSNVLNVIKEPEARLNVLENIKTITKPGAPIYITVYEGSGKGNEGVTKSGYQLNRKTADYLEEIQQVFPNAKRRGKLIIATNSSSVNSSSDTVSDEIRRAISGDIGAIQSLKKQGYKIRKLVNPLQFAEVGTFEIVDPNTGKTYNYDNSVSYYSKTKVTSSTKFNGISSATEVQSDIASEVHQQVANKVKEVMTNEWHWKEDDVNDYSRVDVTFTEDNQLMIEVGIEVGYSGLMNMCDALDPIVQYYDADSYFEPVDPGIIAAWLSISEFDKIATSSEVTIQGGFYDPPEDSSWEELDSDDEVIELTLDAIVHIDEDGSWEYDDTNYPWAASPDNRRGDWYTDEYDVYIGDKTSIVEYVDGLIEPMMPAKAGEYRIKGDVTLVFSVEGIEVKRDYFWDERHGLGYDEEAYTDDAETSFLYDKSYIKNFEITER